MIIVGLALQPDHPSSPVLPWPRLGIGQTFGCAMLNRFRLGNRVDGPKSLSLFSSLCEMAPGPGAGGSNESRTEY